MDYFNKANHNYSLPGPHYILDIFKV